MHKCIMPNIPLVTLDKEDIKKVRKNCLKHFYVFSKTVMGYDDIIEELHGEFCRFLEGPETRKQGTLPRSFVKTWLATISYSIWIALPRTTPNEFPTPCLTTNRLSHDQTSPQHFPTTPFVPLKGFDGIFVDPFYLLGTNIRILIASYVVGNSMKMINLIRKTYERNQAMQILFPDVIPDNFSKVKWSDTEACINRTENFTESTFEAGGIGGSTTSRHYDLIIEDDLIYANKDDFSDQELQPSQDDINKAIGWHKLAMSLLVPGPHTRIHNIGTRWAKHDLVDYIRSNEPDYKIFDRAITLDATLEGDPTWPSMYDKRKIKQIYQAQGPYMFATQYLNRPMAQEDMLFKETWLQISNYIKTDILGELQIITTTDLSQWNDTDQKKSKNSRGVVLTCAWDQNNHVWILRYDVARFNPSQIIDLWYVHNRLFGPKLIGVEAVYYQKSIMHFAKLEMQKKGWLPIVELKTSTHVDKDARIRGLEPYAMNGAIHCHPDHTDFRMEFKEYIPGSNFSTKDILDALAYQLQLAKPGAVKEVIKRENYSKYKFETKMDDFLDVCWGKGKTPDAFERYKVLPQEMPTLPSEEESFDDLIQPLDLFNF